MSKEILKIELPDGYEYDEENSTSLDIKLKKKYTEVRTWEDLIGKNIPATQVWVRASDSNIIREEDYPKITKANRFEFIDAKHAKSALAMSQISQLMPYYGGAITDEEWCNKDMSKYCIIRYKYDILIQHCIMEYRLLTFHTSKQAEDFLKYNEQLVKDYLMID